MKGHVLTLTLTGEEAMERFGRRLAAAAGASLTLFLHGDLGMGKTTLCRGILRGAGHDGSVKSPTYTLVEPYKLAGRPVYHFDLYRLSDPEELEFLGIRDYFDGAGLRLIEWPEKGAGMLPEPDIQVRIELAGKGRRLTLDGRTEAGRRLIAAVAAEAEEGERA